MKTNMFWIIAFIFIASAFMVSAEEFSYVYTNSAGDIVVEGSTDMFRQINVTLPNTTLDLKITNEHEFFILDMDMIDIYSYPVLNLTSDYVSLPSVDFTGDFGDTNDFDYVIQYSYAIDIPQLSGQEYDVSFDFSGVPDMENPVIFKCDYDFVALSSSMNCTKLSTSVQGSYAKATTTGFSSFFLTEDCSNNCGGSICAECTSGGSTGGGGGSGGGSSGGPKLIYVTPTKEGSSVKVRRGDELVIQFEGADYPFDVSKVGNLVVNIKSLFSFREYEINLGSPVTLNLKDIFSKDVEVAMHVSNNFAVLTFSTIEPPRFEYDLLPPTPGSPGGSQSGDEGLVEVRFPGESPTPAGTALTTGRPAEDVVSVPASPITLWTLIIALVFVIFLVGGLALYRARLKTLEKPPTVARTGLEMDGLPETSSDTSKPDPVLFSKKKGAEDRSAMSAGAVSGAVKAAGIFGNRGRHGFHISAEKELELKKYIYHAFSLGFSKRQVKAALDKKGWPTSLVDDALLEVYKK